LVLGEAIDPLQQSLGHVVPLDQQHGRLIPMNGYRSNFISLLHHRRLYGPRIGFEV
jgi:hypothetical protein